MPPVRGPQNAKGLKTERTHEENQERAYIAASRRSDRSLEARIESARRASEIHKKRTGRALRVTEQDVINEEMYEEEDDDLQSQYRRLQAHLGSSADLFNGRLSAWVLSHYGTRQMAMAAQAGLPFNPAMNMQPPTTPFFAYQPQPQSPTTTLAPGMTQRSQSYRQSPYPQQYHRMPDQRSHSLASISQEQHLQQSMNESDIHVMQDQRRHSLATPSDAHSVPGTPQSQTDANRPPMSRTASNTSLQPGHLGHAGFYNNQHFADLFSPHFDYGLPQATSSFDPLINQMQSPISPTTNPLTTTLPPETQQIIGNQFEPNNPYNQLLMNMSHGQPIPQGINYTYRPNAGSSTMKSEGINQTLSPNPMVGAPLKVETNVDNLPTPTLTHGSMSSNDQLNSQYVGSGIFDATFGLGMDFGGSKTPGDLTTTNTPEGLFDFVQEANDEYTQ